MRFATALALIVAKLYPLACQIADRNPISLAKRRDGSLVDKSLVALDAQRFFYYAGIAYAAMRRYEDASRALLTCISLPAFVLGAVHLAAYKKLVLVSLLARGKLDPLPRYLSLAVSRSLETQQQARSGELFAYMQLAKAFEEATSESLMALVNNPVFAIDGNAGIFVYF